MTLGQAYRWLAVFFGVLAAITGFFFIRMRWVSGGDFDITGFLWIASNLGRLSVLFLFITCVGAAISYWVKSWRVG